MGYMKRFLEERFSELYECPEVLARVKKKPRSIIAFYCDLCGEIVCDYEIEAYGCCENSTGEMICHACVATIRALESKCQQSIRVPVPDSCKSLSLSCITEEGLI